MLEKLFKRFGTSTDFTNLIERPTITYDEIAEMLRVNPDAVRKFEEAYMKADFNKNISDNLFKINAKQISELKNDNTDTSPADEIISKIIKELIAQTQVYCYNPDTKESVIHDYTAALTDKECIVSKDDIDSLPVEIRPQLTGSLAHVDVPDSGMTLLAQYKLTMDENAPADIKRRAYHSFRQGLDILDIDNLTYAMIDTNPNSMGNWLPKITNAVDNEGFFKIPATKIIKVPLTMLQLTRNDYLSLSRTTLDIVDKYCHEVFGLDDNKEYFIKTGTYSSKFDFRNARVSGAKEVRELGEYLLYIHWKALQMAHFDLSGRNQPVIYGVSTTTEWVVREFIPDKEDNLTIYHGLPLRTEYRAFVDFDTNQVLGIHPYWDPDVMKKNFAEKIDTDLDARHDYVTYKANEKILMNRYENNKDTVIKHLASIIPDIDLHGQYSIDIMQNGDDFYIIDMALAENSAFYKETVPAELRCPIKENWLPLIKN